MLIDFDAHKLLIAILFVLRYALMLSALPGLMHLPKITLISLSIALCVCNLDIVHMNIAILNIVDYIIMSFIMYSILKISFSIFTEIGRLISISTGMMNTIILNPLSKSNNDILSVFMESLCSVLILNSGYIAILLKFILYQNSIDIQYLYNLIPKTLNYILIISIPMISLSFLLYVMTGVISKILQNVQLIFIIAPIQMIFGIFVINFSLYWMVNSAISLYITFVN